MQLDVFMHNARACRICEHDLPHGCRPLLQGSALSRIVVIGQAPGAAAHESGTPWDDRSGTRLRDWLGVSADEFYNPRLFALLPMGFCYPGRSSTSDLRPRPECAPEWHPRLLPLLAGARLTVLVGKYAADRYLKDQHNALTNAVRAYTDLLPTRIALPHPSPRNNIWLRKHPWFEREVIPALQHQVRASLAGAHK